MTRSLWKGPYIANCFFRQKYDVLDKNNSVEIYSRSSVVTPRFVGQKVKIHNGQKFVPLLIKTDMVGHKFGEFAFTKKKPSHKKKTKTKK